MGPKKMVIDPAKKYRAFSGPISTLSPHQTKKLLQMKFHSKNLRKKLSSIWEPKKNEETF
jgi:hypothetical protein